MPRLGALEKIANTCSPRKTLHLNSFPQLIWLFIPNYEAKIAFCFRKGTFSLSSPSLDSPPNINIYKSNNNMYIFFNIAFK